MSFYGPMVCLDCGFRVKDKTATPNPFFQVDNEDATTQEEEAPESPPKSLGAALYEWSKTRNQ